MRTVRRLADYGILPIRVTDAGNIRLKLSLVKDEPVRELHQPKMRTMRCNPIQAEPRTMLADLMQGIVMALTSSISIVAGIVT
jgi:hypothetical protein